MIEVPFDRFDVILNCYGSGAAIVSSSRLHNNKIHPLYRSQVVTVPTGIVFIFGLFGVVYHKNCDKVRLGMDAKLTTVHKISPVSERHFRSVVIVIFFDKIVTLSNNKRC